MSYLVFIVASSFFGFILVSLFGFFLKRNVWFFNKAHFASILIFYLFFWVGDALSIRFGYYDFDSTHLLGIWIGGIPLEDHVAGILGLFLVRCLFNLFEFPKQIPNKHT
jgi:lycopene cyclase domain-containing protein